MYVRNGISTDPATDTAIRKMIKETDGDCFEDIKLAAVFYRLKLIEAYGTGMPKIMKAYEGSRLVPKIEATSNAFKITLPNRNTVGKESSTPDGPRSKEEMILGFIASNGHIVRSDVDTLLDVSPSTANRILKRMVADGLLYQDGSGRKTKYKKN